ncbi:TipJ family phage tail tip protein [Acinetobacter pittii]|uniref:TipJ family phage tail tip protein n=1 Tax=Acinetobacter pittii TaxID=48296 RepID=UPI0019020D16|nr:phage tail protein [Acinetobacter pittii]MBJ9935021.1 phage tail protein [Acinetobacter pittii]
MSIVKGSKKGSGQARQPNIAPDSAQSKTRINILYGLAEGEIEGLASGNKSILLENTPLEDNNGKLNFESVKVDFRSGTNDQDYIEGFPAVESETAIDVELKAGTPWVKSFKNLDLDALRIRLKWGPLRTQDATSGDVSGVTIEYAVDLQTDGGSWTEVLKTKISDKTSANYERAHRINLPKADSDWLIRVRRITPNSTSEYVSDKMYIEAVTEVIDAKLRYPNTALLGLQYDAETFNNVAKIAVECKGTKIKLPSNYNPVSRTYAGMWDGTFISAYSNNPAWVYYDICTSDRYGLGDRLTPFMIDKWSLYRLGQYCDESVNDGQGGQEPRFTCNVYLQRAEEAYEILKKLAGVFRAISYWDGNSIICDADIPQDTYFTYTRANVIGEFEYSGTRARDRHNVVKVAFDNPANHYKTEYEYVRDEQAISDSGQVRILDLNAWGCTSRGQAQRAGLWALKSEQSETRTVTFKVGLDGWIPQPGRVIEIADELFAGRANGGRVSTLSEDRVNLTIDRDDVIAKPGDRLVVNGENGKAQTRVIQSINGRVITVTLPFDLGSIAAENIWVIDAQDLATMKFRVISIRQEEKNKFTINAIQYNSKKFDQIDNGAYFEEVPISVINPTIQDPVSDILITSENKVNQGINITTMILSWKQAKGAVKYLVEWRKDNGSWLRLPLTGNNSLEVPGVYSGNYQARVTAISAFEVSSLPVYSPITELVGKKGVPPKLEFIRATGILFGMQLDWSFPNVGAQDAAYVEIRVSPDGVSNIAPLGQFAYPTNTHKVQGLQPNLIQYYSGRIVDKIGNVGAWSEWTNGTTTADPEAVLDLISGHIAETDLAQELQGKIENTVNVAEAAEQAAANAQTAANSAQTAATNAQTAAGEAKTAASNAQSAATSAQAQASTAQQVANDANAIAANAKNTADQAAASAMIANTAASEAKTTAANASTAATNAQTTANNAAAAASKVASDLTTSTNQLNQKIADESSTRTAAISKLNDGLTTETTQRKSEDAALLSNIETYKSSTNGTLSSLQTQITTNATNTTANSSKITSLDSRLTTNEGKTADAISAAATAQQTANTAVTNAASAASAVTALKAELSSGKGINNIIAPFSDPQELPILGGAGRVVSLVDSLLRRNGKAYKIAHTAAAHYVYFGTAQAAQAPSLMCTHIEAGRSYMFSAWIKALSTAIPSFRFNIVWFLRNPSTGEITTGAALIFPQGQTDSYIAPTANGQRYSFKAVTAPANAIGATIYAVGNPSGPTASEYLVDMLMLEESLGSEKPASTWVAGPADLNAIKNAFDATATAVNNLTTRVANDEGIITSQGNSITQLNNSITSINGTLSTKADSTALNALTNRVSTAEGQITAQGSAIVSLKNDLVATNNALTSKADSSALNSLDSKVTNIDGRVTSNTNAVTSLQGRITTVESGLSTKADASALSNYYTKTEADSATSGAINTFNSQLTIGGVNAVANSEAPRTSTAATNKEYLLYERSAELKAFYDENLDKPITISFEMSVPVVGPVQVYSSNSSAHTFAVSVNAVIPNQFIKYSVTVNPKTHTASTTVSTIEFYGVYGTGRIPTIRKLQIEAGTKATAWSPSPRDTKALIDANATAIQTTQTKVDNIDGLLTAATESITSLGSRMTTAEGNITGTNNAVNGLSTRMATAEGKITNQSDSITSLQNSVASINGTLANKADSSVVTNLTSRVTAAEGNITSQSGQITTLNNSLTTTNNTLNDVNALARLLSLGKPLRDDPTFKTTSSGGLSAYVFPTGTSWVKQSKSTDNPTDSTSEMLIRATQALGGGWYPTVPTLVLAPNKTFLIKQIIKMPVGTKLLAVGNTTGSGGYIKILGNDLGTGKFETYYTVIQGGTDAANTIQGHNRVVNGTNPPVPSTANPVDVILASYEVFDVTAVNDTIPKAYSDSIAANASAISNLTNTVTQQGNTITSHSNSITTLNNSITSINGSLANKAESSALQSLDSKVTAIDGKVTSNTSALTALQSSFDGMPNQGVNLLGPEISNPVEKPTNWLTGLAFDVINSPDTSNVRAFQFTMPAANGSGTYFNIGGGQTPRQWLTEGKYIFSFVAKTVDGAPPHPIDWLMYNVSATRLRFNITATLTRYSGVFTVPAGGASACMLLIGNPTAKAAGQVVVIERMMLERQVGTNATPSTWIAGSDPSGMIISTQAKATDLFNTATNQNSATAGRVTSLESRMTSTEGALSTKADASALQTLDTKVTNVDGKVTSNTNAITSLSSTLSNATSSISMNAGNSFTDWTVKDGYGEYSIVAQADGQAGRVIQLGNNSGNDMIWLHPNNFIPFDSAKTYRLRARYRRRAGTGTVYIGIAQKTPDKALYVTTSNTLTSDMNSSNYIASAQNPTADQWQEVVAYIKGRAAGAATGSGSQASPRTVSQMTGFITPMFLANYPNAAGTVELDYLILEDAEAIAGNQANATALTTLDTKVTEVDGRLATATNSITSLGSRMSTAEGNISATNTAVSGLSTRMTAAEGGLTNQSNSITSLTNSINSLDSDSLIPDYNLANPEKWISHYGYDMKQYFKTTTTGKVGNTVFRKDTTVPVNCFNYSLTAVPNDRTYRISFWVRCSSDSNGSLSVPVMYGYADGLWTTARYTALSVPTAMVPAKDGNWYFVSVICNLTSNTTIQQMRFGIAPGHTGTTGWWEVQGYKVSPVLTTADADSSFATSAALSSLTSTVNQQGSTITSQGSDITNLKNSVTSINGTLTNKADASAVNTLSNRVTAAEGNITSQGNSITSLNNTLANNDLSNLILNPDFVDPKSGWTAGVIVDATDAAPNPPSPKALKLNNRDSYYGPFVKCNVGDMFYVSAWFATPNTSATASVVLGLNTRNSSGTYAWYSVAIKSTDKTTWTMVEGYFTIPAGAVEVRPWLQVSIAAADAAAQLWHVTNIQVRNITGNKKLASDLQATSSALSTLDSKVTNIDGRVTSASNNIVTLNNSVTNINTALSQKADASALSSLSNRVTTAEGNISSQGSSITSLTNNLAVTTNTANAALPKIQGGTGAAKLFRGVLVFQQNGANVVGNIVIQTPITFTSKMFRLALTGYNYLAGKTDINLNIGGYAYTGTSIIQHGVVNSGTLPIRVRLGVRNGTVVVILTSQAPNAYWQYPKFNIDAEIGYTTPPDDWINGWSASLIAEADLASNGISAIVEPSLLDVSTEITANASAISNLTNTVTQQGDTITSHSNSITTLNNSITSINGALNTKASTSAVTDLDSRVTTAEGKITANTSSITSLTANLKNVANGITMSASLDVDPDSEWIYWTKNGEVARADDTSALGGKVYRFGNNAGNDHVNARSKAKLPFDQTKTYRIRARYRRLNGTGTVYCAVCCLALDGISHVNSSNTVSSDFGSSNYFVINQSPTNNVWQEVTVYVKGRATGAAAGSWTLAAPRQMPNATAFLSVQFLANYSNAAGMTELDYIIIEDADAIAANDATANALSSLDTRVTTAEGKITSQGSSITSLNNSITTINGTLSSKADSSALTNLANRVTVTEGSITSQGSSITSLNSSVNGLLKDIEVTDTRSTNQPPSWYWTNYPKRIVREFKQASTIGLTGMGTYVSLETYVYYSDATGGAIIQIARGSDSKLTAERRSASTSTWGAWSQDIKTLSDGLANKAEASALTSLDAKVTTIDGKVSTQATSITNLTTTVGGHTSSIQSQQQSIDGLTARATLKLQSGNLVGGVGIENDSKTVDFIIQANRFAIGAPSTVTGTVTPKYAFTYQSTSTTLPNGTVIPAGLYLDNASIGYINADKINATSLSAISANLGTLTTLKDPAKPNGARMVLTGSLITVYDDNNVMRVKMGLWD